MSALFLLAGQACLGITGLIVFVIYNLRAFQAAGQQYEYSCPLTAMWAGLATLWYTVVFLTWWLLSSMDCLRRLPTDKTAFRAWIFFSGLFAVEGAASVVGWALADNEAVAAGISALWIVSGILGIVMSRMLLYGVRKHPDAQDDDEEPDAAAPPEMQSPEIIITDVEDETNTNKRRRLNRAGGGFCSCWCRASFWVDLTTLFLVAVLAAFTTAYTIQAIWSAVDARSLTPPGQIYTVPIREGLDVKMHLHCYGGDKENSNNNDNNKPTVIFEHGGGSNSVALTALADEIQSTYQVRVCLYDRLGYGFTPTLYTSLREQWRLPNGGVILSKLLEVAGETGPFVCSGHSAGAEQCLWLAHGNSRPEQQEQQVLGVAMLDGYPDLIHAGGFRPGKPANPVIVGATLYYAFWTGATGLTRGFVGNVGLNFVPQSAVYTMASLYGQARFWMSQYWDVRADFDMPNEQRLYQQLQGYQDDQRLYHYGGTLSGVRVLVLPAYKTVTALDCNDRNNSGDYCCGPAKNTDAWCQYQIEDSNLYRSQTELYASTLSNDTDGSVQVAPAGSAHDYPYHRDYYQWASSQIGERFLSSMTVTTSSSTSSNATDTTTSTAATSAANTTTGNSSSKNSTRH